MKKRIAALLIFTAMLMSFMTSCLFSSECEVTYDYCGARSNVTITLDEGSYIPEDTPKCDGYVFGGWYTDKNYTQSYDFSYPVNSDIRLYAKWIQKDAYELDYRDLLNNITLKTVRSALKINVEKYNTEQGLLGTVKKTNITNSTGSGVVYAEKYDSLERCYYYYCLTNNHVVSNDGKTNISITITDYQGYVYESAELLANDPDYDLAVVKFKKNISEPLECIEIDMTELAIGETVIAIGSPGGQMNAITFGNVINKDKVDIDQENPEKSNVTFSVIEHDAHMDNGSSGGVLLNTELKLIGINYAAASDENGEFVFGCAVPSEKVIEFLNKYDLK